MTVPLTHQLTSLRDFVELLDHHGQLCRWTEPISLEPGIRDVSAAAALDRLAGPAVLFDDLPGYGDQRIAMNVHGSFGNLALLLGREPTTSIRDLFEELAGRWDPQPGLLNWVSQQDAPVHSVRHEGAINLFSLLPLFRINAYDGGFYIAKANVISHDPTAPEDFDRRNVGIYRIQVQGADRVSILTAASHDMGRHIAEAERLGLPLRVAIMIGAHPYMTMFGGTPLPYGVSEFSYAAGALGQPLAMTTTGNGLDVLAESEMVIEAELIPGERVPEGPFGEFTGTYTNAVRAPVFQVTAVSSREAPIFENIYLGPSWAEIDTLQALITSVPVYADLKESFPEVAAVNAFYQHGFTVVISVRNRFAGFAKSVAHRAIGSAHGLLYMKNIILVDDDVDPFDLDSVMWSLSTRTRADDIQVLPNMPLNPLDPSALVPGKGHRLIIDATKAVAPDPVGHSTPIDAPPQARLRELQKIIADLQRTGDRLDQP